MTLALDADRVDKNGHDRRFLHIDVGGDKNASRDAWDTRDCIFHAYLYTVLYLDLFSIF